MLALARLFSCCCCCCGGGEREREGERERGVKYANSLRLGVDQHPLSQLRGLSFPIVVPVSH
jgi:hypothetical protein